jgi:hypothetical protein
MQETFNSLIKRSLNIKQSTVGDPFEVIPIKNAKNAKNCTEIHLSDKELQEVINFDKFPNLECLWLNNNKLEKLEGLETNFRLRELYLHKNKLKTIEGSIPNLLHLRTLTLAQNEIRDLDKNLEILQKFKQLVQLDLSGNPVAEEPNYRIRVIQSIPSVQVLDRHVVTLEERAKAKEWYLAEVKGIQVPKKAKRTSAWQASQSEINLDKEAKSLKEKQIAQKQEKEEQEKGEIEQRFKRWYTTNIPPTATFLLENRAKLQALPITEWEKNYLMPLFKNYDKEKKGILKFADAKTFYDDLIDDRGCIGLAPNSTFEEFCIALKINSDKDNTITWNDFRIRINDLRWTKADLKKTQERIDGYYKEANKLIFMGKGTQAPDLLHKATRLENALSK